MKLYSCVIPCHLPLCLYFDVLLFLLDILFTNFYDDCIGGDGCRKFCIRREMDQTRESLIEKGGLFNVFHLRVRACFKKGL